MKITQEEIVDRQTVLHIELEDNDLDPYLDRGYRRVVQRTAIPGFRKGKAPRRVVEHYLGRESLLNEVLDSMLPEVASRAISERELDAAGLPSLELLELAPVSLKATVPLTPEVDLASYADIRVPQEAVEITEEDVDGRLDQIRHSQASWEPVERPVAMGDLVTIQAAGTVQGRTILDEKDAVFFLDEDGSRPFPGFAQNLVGVEGGAATEFELTIPEDFTDTRIAGQEAHFSVTVKEIKERVLPDLDDEFAKGVGDGFESLEELRAKTDEDLRAEAQSEADRRHREAVVAALLEGATVDLPPVMVEHETQHIQEDQERVLGQVNVRMDDYLRSIGKTEDEMGGEMRDQAVERLKRNFLISKVAEVEGLEVADEEVQERVESLLAESKEGQGRLQDTDELRSSVGRIILAEKAVDRLVAIAKGEEEASGDGDGRTEEVPESEDESEQ